METSEVPDAVAAGLSTASMLGLEASEATVLQRSNRIVIRLLPCDVVARVALVGHRAPAALEVELARQLAAAGAPVAALDARVEPRVQLCDGFVISLWAHYEQLTPREVAPAEYAEALQQLHAGLRKVDIATPHFTDRVAEAEWLAGSPDHTPDLPGPDREFLCNTLRTLGRTVRGRGSVEQLLHGEPHPGNLLTTSEGLLFTDFETGCRGPIEFDIAHAPEEVDAHYGDADRELVRQCRLLVLAMIATWRWDTNDRFPSGRRLGRSWLAELRAGMTGLDTA